MLLSLHDIGSWYWEIPYLNYSAGFMYKLIITHSRPRFYESKVFIGWVRIHFHLAQNFENFYDSSPTPRSHPCPVRIFDPPQIGRKKVYDPRYPLIPGSP